MISSGGLPCLVRITRELPRERLGIVGLLGTLGIAAVMYTNWEQTADLRGCLVPEPTDDGSMPLPLEGSCTLGNMPSYVVNVTRAEDIVATVKLAAEYNLRFRIKNVRTYDLIVTLQS